MSSFFYWFTDDTKTEKSRRSLTAGWRLCAVNSERSGEFFSGRIHFGLRRHNQKGWSGPQKPPYHEKT